MLRKLVKFNDPHQNILTPFYLEEDDFNDLQGKFAGFIVKFSL